MVTFRNFRMAAFAKCTSAFPMRRMDTPVEAPSLALFVTSHSIGHSIGHPIDHPIGHSIDDSISEAS